MNSISQARRTAAPCLVLAAIMAAGAAAAAPSSAGLCPATSPTTGAALREVVLYAGDVADNASLAPDSSRMDHGITINTWRLDVGEPVSIVCRYGRRQPPVTVSPPRRARTCTIRYRDLQAQPYYRPLHVSCR